MVGTEAQSLSLYPLGMYDLTGRPDTLIKRSKAEMLTTKLAHADRAGGLQRKGSSKPGTAKNSQEQWAQALVLGKARNAVFSSPVSKNSPLAFNPAQKTH